jgi:tRNA nucleotidyltransferase (CCA-adding enzyme)
MSKAFDSGKRILRILKDNGYEAYFVGGFVRDFLLGIKSMDIDIATSALPSQVMAIFPKAKGTGEKYGTVSVFMDEAVFEVTTFRNEGEYLDSRHPEFVAFTSSLEADLKRRDFTINALAMDIDLKIIDRFESQTDLKNGLIRAIGEADIRFKEDALRILRAFRFVSKFGFDLEPKTAESITKNMSLLKEIAIERVMQELKQVIEGNYATKAIKLMAGSGFGDVFPELKSGLDLLVKRDVIRLSAHEFYALGFYLDGGGIPDGWRFSNRDKNAINRLIDLIHVTSHDQFNELIIYVNGLELCLQANNLNQILYPGNDQSERIKTLYESMPIHKTCDLAFKGQDMLDLGLLKDARVIGGLIDDITYQVITLQMPNSYIEIKKFVENKLESMDFMGEDDGK